MSKEITEDILLNAGFKKKKTYSLLCSEYYYIKLKKDVFVEAFNVANMLTRNWHVKVINSDNYYTAEVDIQTIDHFNKFMELMDIDFRLKEE